MKRHVSDDQLLDRMYGVAAGVEEETGAHLASCASCAERAAALERRRAESAAEAEEIPNSFLAVQRRAIYARLEQPAPARTMLWAPALAAGFLLALGVLMIHPAPHASPKIASSAHAVTPAAHTELNDDQLFSDVFSLEQANEPRAAEPLTALFEEPPEQQ